MIINLQKDYKKIMLEKIGKSGLRIPNVFDEEKLIIMYYSYLRKKAFAGPNKVLKSKDFNCPKDYEVGFKKLENIIEFGGDITPYFNRWASDLSKYDGLFSDWGILHFHLGDKLIDGEHLVERGDPVLFAYLKYDTVYFINIYPHGHWENSNVIQTLYNNWPEILSDYMLPEGTKLTHEISPEAIKSFRKNGIITFVTIKNKNGNDLCLMPPGMGITSARTAVNETRLFQKTMNDLGLIQLDIISKEDRIIEDMELQGIVIKQELFFELINFDQNYLYLIDKNHEYTITVEHA